MMGGSVGAHLVQQVCQQEQEVSLAGPELSQDPWTDACWQTGTTCGWASPARCHHFLCRAGDIIGFKSSLCFNVSSNTPDRLSALTPLHWPLGVVGCCSAGETSFIETKKECECHCAEPPQQKKLRKCSLNHSVPFCTCDIKCFVHHSVCVWCGWQVLQTLPSPLVNCLSSVTIKKMIIQISRFCSNSHKLNSLHNVWF